VIPRPVDPLWCVAWIEDGGAQRVFFFNEDDARKFKKTVMEHGLFSICWRMGDYSVLAEIRGTPAQ
jgi:hypothetical protein